MTLFVRIILFLLTSIGYGSSLEAQISDPIPEAIEPGEIVMPLEDWLQAPATGPEPTLARLSVMKPIPVSSSSVKSSCSNSAGLM